MPDARQLPFLISLLEDDSASVRESVLKELRAFGPDLELELARQSIKPGPDRLPIMHGVLEEHRRMWLREVWSSWFTVEDDKQKLEMALMLLAEFMHGRTYHVSLKQLLDQLARDFAEQEKRKDGLRLAQYLFNTVGLKGASQEEYYNPLNSSLIFVLEQKTGIPISLACVYIAEFNEQVQRYG
jgi:hypothetical protein